MVLDLGRIDFEECYKVQKDMVRRRRAGEIEDSVLFAEHDEIFTIGRTGSDDNILVPYETLLANGLKVLRIDRGGDVTFHGPGQLVIYPIIDLKTSGKDLHKYLRDLEELAIRFLKDYSIKAERVAGKTGAWIRGRKIASVGVGASGWITYHGLSININCDLRYFSMINPCGMKDVEMTSLERIKGSPVEMAGARKNVTSHLKGIFGLN